LRDVLEILFVLFGDEHLFDAPAVGGQDFFLEPADGQHPPRRVISPVMARSRYTGLLVSAETMEVHMEIPADGPSLGMAPSGTWMWISTFL
jgi:hypothetical protein